ncbi:MAG: ROK family protein [Candidatus Peregrinibacteria bacterium]|nr:ROK family protein [Candidatus Peregrinibacteria bacterium]
MATSVIGFDLGGTKSAVVRYDAITLTPQASERTVTSAEKGLEAVLEDVLSLIEKLRTPDTVAVGLGVPGLILQPEGRILRTPNIRSSGPVDALALLRARLNLPVAIENDAHCFTLAEAIAGAGQGSRVCVGITMGTGVGGGIVVDGELLYGHHGFAGEIGHMLLQPGVPPFKSEDTRGEVEQFLSGTAMGKRCEAAERPEDYLEGQVCAFMQPQVFREVAWLCTSIVYLLDPSIIVFGGSAGRALKPHLPVVTEELRRWLLPDTPLPALTIAKRDDAATLGAAILALRAYEKEKST